jgi:SAM-dependent methyltransferase
MSDSPPAKPACPICDAPSRPAYWAAEYKMYRCTSCGTAFVHPAPGPDVLRAFYDRFHQSDSAGGCYDQFEARMQSDFPAKVRLVRQAMSAGAAGRVLDVGCGKGFFVKACADAGLDAGGIDLSESGVHYARQTLGVRATCGDLHDLAGTLGEYDIVTFWATIEHLPDPVGTLRDIARVLRPGGTLLCDTGIGDDWLDRLLPGVVQWYDPPQHLFVFSARGITRAMDRAGLTVRAIDRSFERSGARRFARRMRNGVLAAGLRMAAAVGRMRAGEFEFTRYPLGNLMSVRAVKP